jgi:hypothetical protein
MTEATMEVTIGIRSDTARHGAGDGASVKLIVRQLHAEHPRAGESKLVRLLVDRMREDDDVLIAGARFIIENAVEPRHKLEHRLQSRSAPPAQKQLEHAKTAAAVQAVTAQIRLLTLVMPNGKRMADCTGTEMAGFSHAYRRIAQAAGPKTVGTVLSEGDVRELMD